MAVTPDRDCAILARHKKGGDMLWLVLGATLAAAVLVFFLSGPDDEKTA